MLLDSKFKVQGYHLEMTKPGKSVGNWPTVKWDRFATGAQQANVTGWLLPLSFAFLFLPAAFRYLVGTSSNTLGLVGVCVILCCASVLNGGFNKGSYARRMLVVIAPITVALVAHLGIAVFLPRVPQPYDGVRSSASMFAFAVALITAGVIADWLLRASTAQIDRICGMTRIAMVLIGIWCFAGAQPPSPIDLVRPSFPFTEPSHYALVAAPFVIEGCVRTTLVRRLLWLVVWLALAVLNQSLSLIVVVAIAAAVSLPIAYAFIVVVPITLIAAGMDLQYYTDRLDLSAGSTNLSSLVYRQGWELMQQGLEYSGGWGIGFQQLGFTPLNVPTSDVIYRILGDDSNLRDGSFFAAKLVSELGLIGITLVVVFLGLLTRAVWTLRGMISISGALQPPHLRLGAAMICAFTVEMFVRGIGYFSSTAILILAAVLMQHAIKKGR